MNNIPAIGPIDGSVGMTSRRVMDQCNDHLKKTIGLDYNNVESVMFAHGGSPGCHSPLLAVFERLVATGRCKSILEFGSGCSTLFLNAIAKKYGARLCSIEDADKWYDHVRVLLDYFKLPKDSFHLSHDMLAAHEFIAPLAPFDLVFSDGSHRTGSPEKYAEFLTDDHVLFIDDCEQPGLGKIAVDWARSVGRAPPRMFMSWGRGEAVWDPANKLGGICTFKSQSDPPLTAF